MNGDKGGSMHHGGSFGTYMQNKINKLQEQFETDAHAGLCEASAEKTCIFQGVSVWVNGRTVPSREEIKHLIAIHGGRFEAYYSRSTVSHIICSYLPDAKVKHHAKERNPTPIVRPEWISDSIKAGQLLPHTRYSLQQLSIAPGQQQLQLGVSHNTISRPGTMMNDPSVQGDTYQHGLIPSNLHLQEQPGQPDPSSWLGTRNGEQQHHQHNGPETEEIEDAQPSQHQDQYEYEDTEDQPAPGQPSNSPYDPSELAAAHRIAAKLRCGCDVLRGPVRSTATDPGGGAAFVDTYFKSSRLHFIGTWKSRLERLIVSGEVGSNAPAPAAVGPGRSRTIIHLDMDCFFASVAEASHAVFRGKPLAVCHSNSAKGTGEVSSANYEARKYGVTASMFISRAKELCPDLLVVPYDFKQYEEVSEQVYRILLQYTSCVQPISCDEAFLDVTGLGDPSVIAAAMRSDIERATQCTASAGISCNMLLARIATSHAKPNGQLIIPGDQALSFLSSLEVSSLPGVGWSTQQKLAGLGIKYVRDIHTSSKEVLQQELGAKAGGALWDFAHGSDDRPVEALQPRKSIGAEVNWGVRFTTPQDPFSFLQNLAGEVQQRAQQAGVKGRTITLKVKRAKQGAGQPIKYLGMGQCDSLSRSVTLGRYTDDAAEVYKEVHGMLAALKVPYDEIRGLGITLTKLDTEVKRSGQGPNALMALWQRAGHTHVEIEGDQDQDKEGATAVQPQEEPQQKQENQVEEEEVEVSPLPATAPQDEVDQGALGPVAADTNVDKDGDTNVSNDGWEDEDTSQSPPAFISKGKKAKSTTYSSFPPAPGTVDEMDVDVDVDEGEGVTLEALLQGLEGTTLTQMNAASLAALPRSLQQELIKKLPRSGKGGAGAGGSNAGLYLEMQQQQQQQAPEIIIMPGSPSCPSSGDEGNIAGCSKPAIPQSFSQIDPTVLEALPIALRREVESAYGIKPARPQPAQPAKRPREATARGLRQHKKQQRPTNKRERLDSFVIRAPRAAQQPAAQGLALADIDPSVLEELPSDIRKELMAQLQPVPKLTKRQKAEQRKNKAKEKVARAAQYIQDLDSLKAKRAVAPCSATEGLEEEDPPAAAPLDNCSEHEMDLPPAVQTLLGNLSAVASDVLLGQQAGLDQIMTHLQACIQQLESGIEKATFSVIPSREEQSEDGSPWRPTQPQGPDPNSNKALCIALAAVEPQLIETCRTVLVSNLDGIRWLLRGIHQLGQEYPFFAGTSAKVVGQVQRLIEARYGWPVSLDARMF